MSTEEKEQQQRDRLDKAQKFIDAFLEGNGCSNFFNKVIKHYDIEFMPTNRDLNPEAYEGEDAEEDGDTSVDVDSPVYWFMIRHMDGESLNWKDFERALKNSQQFPWHTAGGSCFFGFIGSPASADGWAGDPDFQNLIADFHSERE